MSEDARPLRDRFAALRAAHPMPAKTGEKADKAFFDELSGEGDLAKNTAEKAVCAPTSPTEDDAA
jgi:hypothetical protein